MNTKRQLATYRHCRLSCWHQRCSFLCTDCIYQNQQQAWWSLSGTVGKSRSQGPAPCPSHSRLQHTQHLLSSTHTHIEGSKPAPQDTAKHATSNELHMHWRLLAQVTADCNTHHTYHVPHTHTHTLKAPGPQHRILQHLMSYTCTEGSWPRSQQTATHTTLTTFHTHTHTYT